MSDPRSKPIPPALIMAAGRGNRLLPLTHDRPKCMLEVGPAPILLHQIQALKAAGVERIEIVTGHGEGLVRQGCVAFSGNGLYFSNNDHYETTTSLYSFGCTRTRPGDEGFLILNSDVLFHPDLLLRLIDDPREQVLLADFSGRLGEEEMKICVNGDSRITAISKSLDPAEAQAENLGVLKVGRRAAERMLELARTSEEPEALITGLCWIPDAINALVSEFEFFALPIGGLPWIEIDYQHDLKRAREQVWPALAGSFAR